MQRQLHDQAFTAGNLGLNTSSPGSQAKLELERELAEPKPLADMLSERDFRSEHVGCSYHLAIPILMQCLLLHTICVLRVLCLLVMFVSCFLDVIASDRDGLHRDTDSAT